MSRKAAATGIVLAVLAALLAAVSPAFAQEEAAPSYRVVEVEVRPETGVAQQGETITVVATVVNLGAAELQQTLEVRVNGAVVAAQTVSFGPNETRAVVFEFQASDPGDITIVLDDVRREMRVLPPETPKEGKMRVGPSVKLNVLRDVVTEKEDALVDLFWSNSTLNERAVNIELTVDLPSGLYIFSTDGAMACAAGRCQGIFEAPPGSVRNMPIHIKADRVGSYFVNLNGRYWPQGDKDAWNPVSLSTSIDVQEKSEGPFPPFDGPPPSPTPPNGNGWPPSQPVLLALALVVIAVIAVAGFAAVSRARRGGGP